MRTTEFSVLVAAALAGSLVLPGGGLASEPEVARSTLDTFKPVAIAADGTRVAWVRRLPDGGQALVVRDSPTSPERIIVPRLKFDVTRLSLGTDALSRTTAVLATGGSGDPDVWATEPTTGALYAVRVDRPGPVRALPVSRRAGAEVAPGLRRGVLSFARLERVGGRRTMTLRVGSLTRSSSRVLWSGAPRRPVVATAVGAGRRVAFTTHATPGEVNVWNLRVARPGQATRSLERLPSGFNSNAGYGPLTMDAAGRHVVASRWLSNGDGVVLSTHDLATGQRVRTRSLSEVEIAVPVGSADIVAYQTSIFARCQTPRRTTGLDPCPLVYVPGA